MGLNIDEQKYRRDGEVIIKLGINSYIKIVRNLMGGLGNWIDLRGFIKGSEDKILQVVELIKDVKFN